MTVTERGRGGSYRAGRGALVARRLARVEAVCHVTCLSRTLHRASKPDRLLTAALCLGGAARAAGLLQFLAACLPALPPDMSGGGVTRC